MLKALAAVVGGILLSMACQLLPVQFREPCHTAAKICQMLVGGSGD